MYKDLGAFFAPALVRLESRESGEHPHRFHVLKLVVPSKGPRVVSLKPRLAGSQKNAIGEWAHGRLG